ncbi:MAG: endonuclease/exonuclease/phosphatase family protein [Gemmatimonadota bacterium]
MIDNRSGFVVLEDDLTAHPDLAHWHGNIGDPVALDLGAPLARTAKRLDIVSWNVAIGLGRIEDVVAALRAGAFDGEPRPRTRPIIILAQEAYRSDLSVPHALRSGYHGGKAPRGARNDIVEAARSLGFSLRYAPSMRNGRHRSDRGNAILSSLSIAHARFFPLPHVRQMRVAIAAELHGLPWLTFATAHIDTRGVGRAEQASALARRFVEQWGTDQTVVLGADLNTYRGTREPLLQAVLRTGFRRVPHEPKGGHTFHSIPVRMLLDHVLVRGEAIASVRVLRLDETPRDRGKYIFGSDHHPLLATIELVPPARRLAR